MMHGAIGLEITALTGYSSSIVDPHGRRGMKARKRKENIGSNATLHFGIHLVSVTLRGTF